MSPRRNATDARSVGPGLNSPGLTSPGTMGSEPPQKRSIGRTKSSGTGGIGALAAAVLGTSTPMEAPKKRAVGRSQSSGAGGIGALASFLDVIGGGNKKKNSSGASVSSMPMPGQENENKSIMRRRKKKAYSDDEFDLVSPRSKGHRSFGGGLDFATASDDSDFDIPNAKVQARMHQSLGSGLDFASASDAIDFLMPSRKAQPQKAVSDDDSSNPYNSESSEEFEEEVELSEELELVLEEGVDGSLHISEVLGIDRSEMESDKPRSSSALEEEEEVEDQDDIFSYYQWSASRQPRNKVQKARKQLNDSLRQGAMLATFEAFMRVE